VQVLAKCPLHHHPHQHAGLGAQKWVSKSTALSAKTSIALWHGTGLQTTDMPKAFQGFV